MSIHLDPNEKHYLSRSSWLRASVLGANDGILSVGSIIVGVASAHSSSHNIFLSGIAGLVAGAISMAAGEYVSVSSQSDTEKADLRREQLELESNPDGELEELAQIYRNRGVSIETAREVARQLTAHDALGAHARDELGITDFSTPRPIQAAAASASAFAFGALLPLFTTLLLPGARTALSVTAVSLLSLILLGVIAAKIGGARSATGGLRVAVWGAIAMGVTALVGTAFGVAEQPSFRNLSRGAGERPALLKPPRSPVVKMQFEPLDN